MGLPMTNLLSGREREALHHSNDAATGDGGADDVGDEEQHGWRRRA